MVLCLVILCYKQIEVFIDELIYDFDDRTILHLAAAEGHYDLVKYILKRNPEYAKKKIAGIKRH